MTDDAPAPADHPGAWLCVLALVVGLVYGYLFGILATTFHRAPTMTAPPSGSIRVGPPQPPRPEIRN